MKARAFGLLTATGLAAAQQRAAAAAEAWARDWLPSWPGSVACSRHAPAAAGAAAAGYLVGEAEGLFVWVAEGGLKTLAGWLFARGRHAEAPAAGSLLEEVSREALAALMTAQLGHGRGGTALQHLALPKRCDQPGAAAVDVEFIGPSGSLKLVYCPDQTLAKAPAAGQRAGMEPLAAALQGQSVTVTAQLGEVEIDLQTLYGLAPGDVIRFDSRVDHSLALTIEGQPALPAARAYLGQLGSHRALEVVAEALRT